MSEFSGKCDLYDSLIMIRNKKDDKDWSKIKIYQKDKKGEKVLLPINNYKDFIPYAAFIMGVAYGNQDGTYIAYIGEKSYVDLENEERAILNYKYAKRIYMKSKRNNMPIDALSLAKKITYCGQPEETTIEICKRIIEHPYKKHDTIGLYYNMYTFYKTKLMEEMTQVGYTEEQAKLWCFENKKTW